MRPDLISKELTPNIARVQELGVTLARHNTVYPSETRTAFPSLVTGAAPVRHGMVGNKFVDRKSTPERYIDTSDAVLLDRLNKESGGRLMTAPTLGELLAASGKSLAVLATNTPGTTRLFHHKAEDFGHIRLSGHFPEACTPEDVLAQIETEFGKLPPAAAQGEPDYSGQEWITSVFLDYVWPRLSPDVAIVSYGEPDTTSHFHGTGSATTREIIAYCDAQFGRVLEWWEAEGRSAGIQLILASDHGHITAHTRVSVMDDLRAAGFAPGRAPEPDVDVVVVPGQVGALYLRDRSVDQVSRLVEAMMDQPWCGPIFTSPRNEVEGIAPAALPAGSFFATTIGRQTSISHSAPTMASTSSVSAAAPSMITTESRVLASTAVCTPRSWPQSGSLPARISGMTGACPQSPQAYAILRLQFCTGWSSPFPRQ